MKKNTSLTIRAHLLRGAFYLLLLLAVGVIPFALAQRTVSKRTLTFAERVAYHERLKTFTGVIGSGQIPILSHRSMQ